MGLYNNLADTGERMLPAEDGEISYVFARHRFTYEYLATLVSGQTVLDVGCGTGYGSHVLAGAAARVVAIDREEAAIEYCREHYSAGNLEFAVEDAARLNLSGSYDAAVCLQVIEHLHGVDAFLAGLQSAVRPGGTLYITTPNIVEQAGRKGNNPFHHHEMTYAEFDELLRKRFDHFTLWGFGYARPNRLRTLLGRMPFYQWGRHISRKSPIKKVAARALDLLKFEIIRENVASRSADLLAICRNDRTC
jgi:SAM-dependent methyltransferase